MVDANVIDTKYLLEKCQEFLPGKWRIITADDLDVNELTLGFGNRNFVCKIKNEASVAPVFIRIYGGNAIPKDAPIRTLNEVTETLVFYKLGEVNYGPKLLGTFDGGRLEEFVEGSRLSQEDFAKNPKVARAYGKSLATFHRLDVPLSRVPWDMVQISKKCYQKFNEQHPQLADCYLKKGQNLGKYERLRKQIEFNVLEFTDWISKVSKTLKTRIVFTHNDPNRSNILIKGTSQNLDDEDLAKRFMLVDYEFCGYSHRGQDIGNVFTSMKFDLAGDTYESGHDYPDESHRRVFVESYVEDMRKSNHFNDWNEDGIDSVDHILMESEFGAICCRFINIIWCLSGLDTMMNLIKTIDERRGLNESKDEEDVTKFVTDRREYFVKKYPQFE